MREDLAQRLVAAARFVVLQAPVLAVEAVVDLRADVAAVKAGLGAAGLELREVEQRVHAAWRLQRREQFVELRVVHEAEHLAVVDQHHRRVGAGAQAFALLHREQAVGGRAALFHAEAAAQVVRAPPGRRATGTAGWCRR